MCEAVLKGVKEELFRRHFAQTLGSPSSSPASVPPLDTRMDNDSRSFSSDGGSLPRGSLKRGSSEAGIVEDDQSLQSLVKSTCPSYRLDDQVQEQEQTDTPGFARVRQHHRQSHQQSSNSPELATTTITPTSRGLLYGPPSAMEQTSCLNDSHKSSPFSRPFASLVRPRPYYLSVGSSLPKVTEYLKYPTLFDELQSPLFPVGSLRSLVPKEGLSKSEEVAEDKSLFEMQRYHVPKPSSIPKDRNLFRLPNQKNRLKVFQDPRVRDYGNHKLIEEFKVMLAAPPVTDPQIDTRVYEIPHDPRIDIVPCPQLRYEFVSTRSLHSLILSN